MLKIARSKTDHFTWSIILFFLGYISSTLSILVYAQSNPASVQVKYNYWPSMDQSIVCKEPAFRSSCNLDFENCKKFVTVRDYYILSYGLGGLAAAISGQGDAQRAQNLQNKAAELAQQAKQSGQDFNVAAFDEVDKHAKGELGWLYSKQAMHVSILGYMGIVFGTWKDNNTGLNTDVCKNFYHKDDTKENQKKDDTKENQKKDDTKENQTLAGASCISNYNPDPDLDPSSKYYGCKTEDVTLEDLTIKNNDNPFGIGQLCDNSTLKHKEKKDLSLFDAIDFPFAAPPSNKWVNQKILEPMALEDFINKHLTEDLAPFLANQFDRAIYNVKIENKSHSDPKLYNCKVTVTACKHLCDVDMNFYNFIVPNFENKKKLQDFLFILQKNMKEINDAINRIQALRSANGDERQAYLDSLKQQNGTPTATPVPEKMDCVKNPYLSGCIGRYTNAANAAKNYKRKEIPVPTASTDEDGGAVVDGDKGGGGLKPGSPGSGGGGGAPSDAGAGGGGGPAPSAASTGNLDDDKKKDDEDAPPLDLQGVSDYGGKKKKSSGGGGSGGSYGSGNNKKSKNPFEDLFGNKKGKDDRGGIHLRDIASSNEAEDEENGFSNLFTRITKTYYKKYHQGQIGNKDSKK